MNIGDAASNAFGNTPPVGHVLRTEMPDRWLRIHSLPSSKRYAETDQEWAELFRRHNEVAREVLGLTGHAILFLHAWGNSEDLSTVFSSFAWSAGLDFGGSTPTVYPDPDAAEPSLIVAGFLTSWPPRDWDSLLRDVAYYRLGAVLFLNPATGEAYAPYDGGADLILSDSARVVTLAVRWAPWLSSRADGL